MLEKTCQIKTTTRKKLYHAIQVLQKQFCVLVSWVERFFLKRKKKLLKCKRPIWIGGGRKKKEIWWMGGFVVVVVGAWKGSGRWTETQSVTFSWVIWTDRPSLWQQCHQSGFSHPQLPISGDLNVTLAFFTLSLSLHGILYPCPPSLRLLYSLFLIVRSDINFLWAGLFSRQSPSVYVMRSLLLLLRLRAFLFQLLSFELRPPVLKPHFYL